MKFITIFALIIEAILISGCSSKTSQDYMNAAHESMMKKNIPEAVINYEFVVKDFPESADAPEALFQLGSLYQNKMVENVPERETYQKAAEFFRKLFDKYPRNKKAPMALFLSGFILANDLKNYEEATTTYNLFLQKYPENELATSAREELNNMGLTPDQILQKKTPKNI